MHQSPSKTSPTPNEQFIDTPDFRYIYITERWHTTLTVLEKLRYIPKLCIDLYPWPVFLVGQTKWAKDRTKGKVEVREDGSLLCHGDIIKWEEADPENNIRKATLTTS